MGLAADKPKILVVDDNELNREMAVAVLEAMGANVSTASGGEEAICICKENAYDAILMDYRMPDVDGAMATAQIRMDVTNANTPIIALTAEENPQIVQVLLEAGIDAVLKKPIESEALYLTLRDYIEKGLNSPFSLKEEHKDESWMVNLKNAGFDISSGIRYSGNAELYKRYLIDFYRLLPGRLNELLSSVESKNIKKFTIDVHALKSNFRALGHGELFHISRELEHMGDDGKLDDIIGIMQKYSSELKELLPKLRELLDVGSKLKALERRDFVNALKELRDAMDTFDLDTADTILDGLSLHEIDDEFRDDFNELTIYIAAVAFDKAIELINRMIG